MKLLLPLPTSAAKDIAVGDRICYRGFLKDACHASFKRDKDGCQIFMLKIDDVLMQLPDTTQVGHIKGRMKVETE